MKKKKLLLGLIIVVALLVCGFFLFPINILGVTISKEAFELNASELDSTYRVNDEIQISAYLKNNTIHAYTISHSLNIISISYYEKNTEKPICQGRRKNADLWRLKNVG